MGEEPKVVSFPKAPKLRRDKTDADHVTNVRKAWRALTRAIADARNFGLEVDAKFSIHNDEPKISPPLPQMTSTPRVGDMTLDDALKDLPEGCRFNVGHISHWYGVTPPKHLRKRPYEAYVVGGEIGTPTWLFESADGATPGEALAQAIQKARDLLTRR